MCMCMCMCVRMCMCVCMCVCMCMCMCVYVYTCVNKQLTCHFGQTSFLAPYQVGGAQSALLRVFDLGLGVCRVMVQCYLK